MQPVLATPDDADQAAAFLDLLGARRGMLCAVGAGGKKSTLYQLLRAHLRLGTTHAVLTATVQSAPPPRHLADHVLVAGAEELDAAFDAAIARYRSLIVAAPSTKPGRLAGLPTAMVDRIASHPLVEVTLVKADGARMRLIKAPSETEPVLPVNISTILPVVSAKAFLQPITETIAHRAERLCPLLDIAMGERLQPRHVARLLASEAGALQSTGSATVVPIINMVDDAERQALAEQAAQEALALTARFDRVVLARMTAPAPIVAVIRRGAIG